MPTTHGRARAGADLRLLRAAVFTAVCVVLSAAGHILASDVAIPLWSLGVGCALVLAVAAPLAGRERSLPGIAALLAVGQVGLHALFGLGQHGMAMGGARPAGLSATERAARLVCGAGASALSPVQAHKILATAGADTADAAGSAASSQAHTGDALGLLGRAGDVGGGHGMSMSLLPSLPMFLGHLLAALVAGWLLRRGELALFRLVRISAQGADALAATALLRSLRAALVLVLVSRTGLPATTDLLGPHGCGGDEPAPPGPHTADLQHTVIRRGPPAAHAFSLAA
ncbi:hypothetical protein [Streptomyces tsukubensis]|uniref:Integral membrane protein n=1 Tax=Streptomyces tsukubensis TaxID=83656 RepID=A0A1V4A8E0_9ACTN|nr:hypothetical protein [Streptomyces tsukubensis]OON79204.1 hypothetical protein B1H18_14650 [Streptomyces tsukubensis]QFR94681.1 hypothetical protein GBW32_18550 [Streptomyces tsukubensis]